MTLVCYWPQGDRIEEWENGYSLLHMALRLWKCVFEIDEQGREFGMLMPKGPEECGRIVLGEL